MKSLFLLIQSSKKIKNEEHSPIYTKLNIEDISDKINDINILEIAIKNKKEIESTYIHNNNQRYKTILQPLKIVNYEGFWYLVALKEGEVRKYYLKELLNIKIRDREFIVDTKIDELLNNSISIWFNQDTEPFLVKLHASKLATKYFKRRPLPTQIIEALSEDDTMEFVIKITHEMEILPIIKYWIPHLHVLEPKWLRDIVRVDLNKYIKEMDAI